MKEQIVKCENVGDSGEYFTKGRIYYFTDIGLIDDKGKTWNGHLLETGLTWLDKFNNYWADEYEDDHIVFTPFDPNKPITTLEMIEEAVQNRGVMYQTETTARTLFAISERSDMINFYQKNSDGEFYQASLYVLCLDYVWTKVKEPELPIEFQDWESGVWYYSDLNCQFAIIDGKLMYRETNISKAYESGLQYNMMAKQKWYKVEK